MPSESRSGPGHLRIAMPQHLAGGKLGLVVKNLVVAAVADTKALHLGFLPGDRILAVNDKPVGNTQEFYTEVSRAMAESQSSGEPVVFDLWRKKDGAASTRPLSGSPSFSHSTPPRQHRELDLPEGSPLSANFHHSLYSVSPGSAAFAPELQPRSSFHSGSMASLRHDAGPGAGSTAPSMMQGSSSMTNLGLWPSDPNCQLEVDAVYGHGGPASHRALHASYGGGPAAGAVHGRRQKETCPAFSTVWCCCPDNSHHLSDPEPGITTPSNPRLAASPPPTGSQGIATPKPGGPARRRKFSC